MELKIATLNEQIAKQILHRSVETQESVVAAQHAIALNESNWVQSDESLGWRLSSVDCSKDISRIFTPRKCRGGGKKASVGKASQDSATVTAYAALKSAETERDNSASALNDETQRLFRAALFNPQPQHQH